MFLKHFKVINLIIFIIIKLNKIEATKCGDFTCEGESVCDYNHLKQKLECRCEVGYVANVTGNKYHCYQPETVSNTEKCLKFGDQCGPEHICSEELICQKLSDENVELVEDVECAITEEKCAERCCQANESCEEGKCILKLPLVNEVCPETLKCQDKCCAENEFCNIENQCVTIENMNRDALSQQCAEKQKCQDTCCKENETCENGEKCVEIEPELKDCPESQRCSEKCCNSNEKCFNHSECAAEEISIEPQCTPEQKCLDICCKELETCNNEKKCVIKPNLEANNSFEISDEVLNCDKNLQCHDKCCKEGEICNEAKECVAQTNQMLECPEAQKCSTNCCPTTQICSSELKCEENIMKVPVQIPVLEDCPLTRQCQNKCCTEQEKCSPYAGCLPVGTFECIETDVCGDKCCPINETCNEDHQCVPFIEIITDENCPDPQKCPEKCCAPHEVCNEFGKCRSKIVKKELSLPEADTDFYNVVNLYDLNYDDMNPACPENYFSCQQKCCQIQQICNTKGDCEEQVAVNTTLKNCEFGENCAENDKNAYTRGSIAYSVIGLGCLVMVLSFALFKVHTFRQANRIVY